MTLNFRNNDRPSHDKSCANPLSPGQVLAQEDRGQDHGGSGVRSSDRDDLARITQPEGNVQQDQRTNSERSRGKRPH